MEHVAVRASRIRSSLAARGSLTLWEVRAILNESRDTAQQVLLWMASRKEIAYRCGEKELAVTLARAAEGGLGAAKGGFGAAEGATLSWSDPLRVPLNV